MEVVFGMFDSLQCPLIHEFPNILFKWSAGLPACIEYYKFLKLFLQRSETYRNISNIKNSQTSASVDTVAIGPYWTLLDPIGLFFFIVLAASLVSQVQSQMALLTNSSPAFSPWMLEGFGNGCSSTAPSARRKDETRNNE